MAEDEIDDRTDKEFIHDQLSRQPTDFAKGNTLYYLMIGSTQANIVFVIIFRNCIRNYDAVFLYHGQI